MDSNLKENRPTRKPGRERIRDFQRKLYRKAKQEQDFRFYRLYDKISLPHFLMEAYQRVKASRGAPGTDGMAFADIEGRGLGKFLDELKAELEQKRYRPGPVKRVYIPKANGKLSRTPMFGQKNDLLKVINGNKFPKNLDQIRQSFFPWPLCSFRLMAMVHLMRSPMT